MQGHAASALVSQPYPDMEAKIRGRVSARVLSCKGIPLVPWWLPRTPAVPYGACGSCSHSSGGHRIDSVRLKSYAPSKLSWSPGCRFCSPLRPLGQKFYAHLRGAMGQPLQLEHVSWHFVAVHKRVHSVGSVQLKRVSWHMLCVSSGQKPAALLAYYCPARAVESYLLPCHTSPF